MGGVRWHPFVEKRLRKSISCKKARLWTGNPRNWARCRSATYLSTPETNEHEELRYGWVVREPTPSAAHQLVMFDIHTALASSVSEHRLGCVVRHRWTSCSTRSKGLSSQPDLLVVLNERSYILRETACGERRI